MELEQQTKFDLLVRQLERSNRHRTTPNYQLKVAALATIGYGYIGVICLGLFSSLWLVRWLFETTQQRVIAVDTNQLWLLLGLVLVATFWVQYIPLSDREIHRTEFPELFTLIDELSIKLKTPKIHHVVINYDHNAAVYQAPRIGLLGWYQNYLLLGLPLLQSLTPEQFRATLSHELGHLAGNDSSFTGYIFRVRQMWEQLTADNNFFVFKWFFRWYEPLIRAYSFVSVRDREYAADALAKRMTSPEIAASDLIQTYIYQHYLQVGFSRTLDCQALTSELPPTDVVTQMLAVLRQPLDPQITQVWLGLILGEATDTDDTHPCLSDRLAAVGYPTPKSWTPTPILCTAAESYFGDQLADLATELDLRWYESRKGGWFRQYQQAQYQREHLMTLNDKQGHALLSLHEATIQADLTTELYGESIALKLWQEILARSPDHPQANYQVGKALIDRGHLSGCAYLEQAIALDPDLVIPSCEELYRFHTFQGDLASAEIYLDWRQRHLPRQWRSKLERNIRDTDKFVAHDLDPDLVIEIRHKLANYPLIERAYLVCKPMQIFTDRPLYILGLKIANTRSVHFQHIQADLNEEYDLCQRLRIELNFDKRLVLATFDSQKSKSTHYQDFKLIEKIQKVPTSNIL